MNTSKIKILVFRFSAMGDVAMTAPVLKELTEQNPDIELVIVSRRSYQPFFNSVSNSTFVGVNLEDYKGIGGLKKLASLLEGYKADMIADLHNVLRTKILKFFLTFSVKKIATLNKGRKEKKKLIQKNNKTLKPLRQMSERYADVFRELGFKIRLSHQLSSQNSKSCRIIGIAPFANYKEKMFPLKKMEELCLHLANNNYTILLFGGGKEEIKILNSWENLNPNIQSIAGKKSLDEEIKLIQTLPLMISMDSANMHIASLAGTRVISIWGATHPFAGFLGYGQKEDDCVQLNTLTCRPCSIFGNKPCYRKDWACMNNLAIQDILSKI